MTVCGLRRLDEERRLPGPERSVLPVFNCAASAKVPSRSYNDDCCSRPPNQDDHMAFRKTADLPLHSGAPPTWLFRRIVEMAGPLCASVIRDSGSPELLRRLSQ